MTFDTFTCFITEPAVLDRTYISLARLGAVGIVGNIESHNAIRTELIGAGFTIFEGTILIAFQVIFGQYKTLNALKAEPQIHVCAVRYGSQDAFFLITKI